jgi:hypothetical protein
MYVPIDYSDVPSVVPEGEDIIYSTLCHVKERGGINYNSHVVFTRNGIAFERKRKFSKNEFIYEPYINAGMYQARFLSNNKFKVGYVNLYNFQLKHAKEFESKTQFKERSQNFCKTITPVYITTLEEHIEKSPPGRVTEKNKKYLQKIKNRI